MIGMLAAVTAAAVAFLLPRMRGGTAKHAAAPARRARPAAVSPGSARQPMRPQPPLRWPAHPPTTADSVRGASGFGSVGVITGVLELDSVNAPSELGSVDSPSELSGVAEPSTLGGVNEPNAISGELVMPSAIDATGPLRLPRHASTAVAPARPALPTRPPKHARPTSHARTRSGARTSTQIWAAAPVTAPAGAGMISGLTPVPSQPSSQPASVEDLQRIVRKLRDYQ
ncbi:MAG: hypothetical protein J2O49_06430 [Sciscionella sp.]|nr:hypothetical protein [Sciscionella sp.]